MPLSWSIDFQFTTEFDDFDKNYKIGELINDTLNKWVNFYNLVLISELTFIIIIILMS